MRDRNDETICAISTPHGSGGIAVIRVSGKQALDLCKKIIPKLSKINIKSHEAKFCEIFDFLNQKIDEVVVTYFADGKSFTGEEVVEISCHGSIYISHKIVDLLIEAGCRSADRGEFTYRSFMNNKLDLIQAESVLSLIESQSELSAKIALRQLNGHLSKVYFEIESELTWCLAHIEASIDFSTEGLDIVDNNIIITKLSKLNSELEKLILSYKSGKVLKDGVKIVLAGEPNVGKSSLLNLLIQDDRAIITAIAGTTRDVIESTTIFEGLKFSISDTAGIRDTLDEVETIGVNKSRKEVNQADMLCFVLDGSHTNWSSSIEIFKEFNNSNYLVLINKSDISTLTNNEIFNILQKNILQLKQDNILFISAHDVSNREIILKEIKSRLGTVSYIESAIVSSARQFESTKYAYEMIEKSLSELNSGAGAEFVAMFLKEGLTAIQKILGHSYDDQILDRVFKEFCLGK